jgi:NADPH-dependent 2,4-dienoyl-CoA reductase/sulfur reductase-like enzyme
MRHVIIGAGIAGVTAAETIKKHDASAEVVLIGDERFFPYKRYLLTEFLVDAVKEKSIFYTSEEYFEDQEISFRKGELVKEIRPDWKSIKFFHNEVMEYDNLLIATGGHPTLGPILAPYKKNIWPYYSLQDALMLKNELPGIETCVIYGEGLSTLDLMRGLRTLGKKVIYITKEQNVNFPLPANLFPDGVHSFLESKGVEIIADDRIVGVEHIDAQYHVLTFNQEKIKCDAVFAWDGYQPHISIIRGSNIEKKSGILVDTYLNTSEDNVYAAGDCVEIYHPELKDYWVNFGWPNAMKQGEIAGKNMLGMAKEYKIKQIIPFNLFGTPLKARWWE